MISSYLSFSELEKEIKIRKKSGYKTVAYLPIGCTEQHGPFLPLETDSIISENFTKSICNVLEEKKYWGHVFPVVNYSPTRSNMNFCGTVSVNEEPFRNYVKQLMDSLTLAPFDALIVISGHGPADPSLNEVSFQIVHDQFLQGKQKVLPSMVISIFSFSSQIEDRFKQKTGKHADWREFLMLYYILGKDYFDDSKIEQMKLFANGNSFDHKSSLVYGIPLELRSEKGVIGAPLPNKENLQEQAKELWEYLTESIAVKIEAELEHFYSNYGKA